MNLLRRQAAVWLLVAPVLACSPSAVVAHRIAPLPAHANHGHAPSLQAADEDEMAEWIEAIQNNLECVDANAVGRSTEGDADDD
jgi:hypothetical protein